MPIPRSSLLVLLAAQVAGVDLPVGGGFTDAGLVGSYYASEALPAPGTPPTFTRKDIRIDFNWGTALPIGGSTAPALRAFPRDRFSVRWEGQLIARFDETYAFTTISDDGIRVQVRAEGASSWQTVIENWTAHAATRNTGSLRLTPGIRYDVRIEYFERTGNAVVRLLWSSPSTPEEVIDSAAMVSSKAMFPQMWADQAVTDGGEWVRDFTSKVPLTAADYDSLGNPTRDCANYLGHYAANAGRWRLRFNGSATVRVGTSCKFVATGTTTLPAGTGYDPATNTTEAMIDSSGGVISISFTGTSRTGATPAPGDGFTNLRLMKPTADTTVPHQVGDVLTEQFRGVLGNYVCARWQTSGLSDDTDWSTRTHALRAHNRSYEMLVMAANESGRDLYVNFGTLWSHDHMRKFAQLVRYGSDGIDPYASTSAWPAAGPAFPPLNPNLRVYLEHGNEQSWSAIKGPLPAFDAAYMASPDGQIINYDGTKPDGDAIRWHAVRTVRMSGICREVFGDAAMGTRVRMQLFGQYANTIQHQSQQFIDDYFNNGTGANVPSSAWTLGPMPVRRHIWGSGGALYFQSANDWGEMAADPVGDGGFESYAVSNGALSPRPTGGAWTFAGHAGVADAAFWRKPAVTGPGSAAVGNDLATDTWVGFRFRVGAKDLHVYELSRLVQSGNSGEHEIMLFAEDGTPLLKKMSVATKDLAAGSTAITGITRTGWTITRQASSPGVLTLAAGTTYVLACREQAGGDAYVKQAYAVTPAAELTVLGAVTATDATAPVFSVSTSGAMALGGLNLRFTTGLRSSDGVSVGTLLDDRYRAAVNGSASTLGQQYAWIVGSGSMTQTVQVPSTGSYGVSFWGAGGRFGSNPVTVLIDDEVVVNAWKWTASRKPGDAFYRYSSRCIPLTAGAHRITFQGLGDDAKACYIDGVRLVDVDNGYFGGSDAPNFPVTGNATGATMSQFTGIVQAECDMALIWGTTPVTYEGGWSAGGDWNGEGANHYQARFEHPYAIRATRNTLDLFHRHGGSFFNFYYDAFTSSHLRDVEAQPMVQAAIRDNRLWTAEPSVGIALPTTLTCTDPHYLGRTGSSGFYRPGSSTFPTHDRLDANAWRTWLVRAPRTGTYTITTTLGGTGAADVLVDEVVVMNDAASGGAVATTAFLTKGLHAIKLRHASGTPTVTSVVIGDTAAAAASPALATVADDATPSASTAAPASDPAGDGSGCGSGGGLGIGVAGLIGLIGLRRRRHG